MAVTAHSALQVRIPLRVDLEQEIVARLIEATGKAGLPHVDPISIINFYVALKSKPLAILAGPAQSGKIALVESWAHILFGDDCLRCQMMIGHPCWAARSPNVALFTEAHTRFNASKILALIEEAWEPENADQVHVACLKRITPAELLGFFSEVAFQLSHGEIMQLPSTHLTAPIPYPPNLFLIGTMDTVCFDGWNADLLSMTTSFNGLLSRPIPPRVTTEPRLCPVVKPSSCAPVCGAKNWPAGSSIRSWAGDCNR